MTGRNERDRLCLIVNPRSAGGSTGRRLNAIKDAAARHFARWEVKLTRHAGHGAELAAESAADFDLVAAVGGDGTANEVVNGLFDGEKPRGKAVFTVVPAGTGSDLIKTLRIPKDLEAAMEVAATGTDKVSDVVAVETTDEAGGGTRSRLCVNVAGFGINGEVVVRANQSSKRLGGTITFFGATLAALASYRAPGIEVRWVEADGSEHHWTGDLWGAFVANGSYCGGGMKVGRIGMQDGLLEVTIVPPLSSGDIARAMPRLYNGRLGEVEGIKTFLAREIEASPIPARPAGGAPIRMDVDGEQPGVLPAKLRVLPGSLVIRALW
jgi:diacylglycerol kinase (ATP)